MNATNNKFIIKKNTTYDFLWSLFFIIKIIFLNFFLAIHLINELVRDDLSIEK